MEAGLEEENERRAQEEARMGVVLMGVSGCGKSAAGAGLAAALGWGFLEGDALHPEANRAKMAAGTPLDDDDRRPWLRVPSPSPNSIRAR